MVQQIIIALLGLFLLGEAIAAAAAMHKGDSLIRLGKYLFTGVIGMFLMREPAHADCWHIVMAIAIALFVFPRMQERIVAHIKKLRETYHA